MFDILLAIGALVQQIDVVTRFLHQFQILACLDFEIRLKQLVLIDEVSFQLKLPV